ncbi:MAG: helix-turn-helix transcriptional regulator [Pseudomonadota bacterium]
MGERKDIRKAAGRQISDLRAARHLTQTELAQKLGISQTQMSRIENGWSPLDITLLPGLALHLEVTISDIVSVIEPNQPTPISNHAERQKAKNKIQLALNEVEDIDDLRMLAQMLGIVAITTHDPS